MELTAQAFETIQLERDGRVAIVTVNRPEKRNALNRQVRQELISAFDQLWADESARVVIITGAGDKAFIAGADIKEFAQRSALEQRAVMNERVVFEEIAEFPKPVLAMINGMALGGGCEIALACDIRIAAQSARLGQPEIKLGIIPGGGGTQRLPRLVGAGQALRLIYTGELIDAREAERIGLVDRVCADEELRTTTLQLAQTIAAHSPLALQLAKSAVRAAQDSPLSAGLRHERELFISAFASQDKAEGMAAFLEKRPAEFRGK